MDWFDAIGNMAAFFPDTPALAYDFAMNGADPDLVGYELASALQTTQTPIDVYPPQETPFPEGL